MLMKKEVIEDNEKLKEEIKDLKKQLEEEKNAYNRMYNMYVEKDNIIKRFEDDLREMYLTFGEFSEEYTEKKIRKLKGESNEED